MSLTSRASTSHPVWLALLLAGTATHAGCVAIPAVYVAKQLTATHSYAVSMRVDEAPDPVYRRLVTVVKQRNPALEVVKDDAGKRTFEGRFTSTMGEKVSIAWQVSPASRGHSDVTVSAAAGDRSGDEVRTRVRDALAEIFAGHEITWTNGG